MNRKDETRLVYSDDPKDKKILDGSLQKESALAAENSLVIAGKFVVVFRIEKSGRNGKPVTVIDRFPKHETYLKQLTSELKTKCGVGGTFYLSADSGVIEIQGDQRIQIKKIFDQKKISYKGV